MSTFYMPSDSAPSASPADAPGAAGGPELSHGTSGQLELQLVRPCDVGAAHQYFQSAGVSERLAQMPQISGLEAAAAGPALNTPGIELALAKPVLPAGAMEAATMAAGHGSALGANLIGSIPGAAEAINPMVQLIMRLPGAMGLANSFFEALAALFIPGTANIFTFNPGAFFATIGCQTQAAFTGMFRLPSEHFPISLSLLPANAPIFQQLGLTSGNLSALGETHILPSAGNGSLGSPGLNGFGRDPLNISGQLDLRKAQFEGAPVKAASGAVHAGEGILAGPGLSNTGVGSHLAGTPRLFSDQLSGAFKGQATSAAVSSATGVPVPVSHAATSYVPPATTNIGATPFGTEIAAPAQPAATAAPAESVLGPSGAVGEVLGSGENNLLAYEAPSRMNPPMGGFSGSPASTGPGAGPHFGAAGNQAGGEALQPLRAKQLSFQELNKSSSIPGKPSTSALGRGAQQAARSGTGSAASQSAAGSRGLQAASRSAHAPSGADSAHSVRAGGHPIRHAQPARGQAADGRLAASEIAATGDQLGMYTVQSGDCLWDIAKRQLGDATRWTEIYNMNTDVIGANPDLIHPGAHLRLPGLDSAPSVADAGKVTIQPGDNLWDLASKHLGDGNRWGELYQANAHVIGDNPRLIYPGQQPSIPGAAPHSVASTTGVPMQGADIAASSQVAPAAAAGAQSGGYMPASNGHSIPSGHDFSVPADRGSALPPNQSYSVPASHGSLSGHGYSVPSGYGVPGGYSSSGSFGITELPLDQVSMPQVETLQAAAAESVAGTTTGYGATLHSVHPGSVVRQSPLAPDLSLLKHKQP